MRSIQEIGVIKTKIVVLIVVLSYGPVSLVHLLWRKQFFLRKFVDTKNKL
jgi:hypothetical protein